jgi:2,3-diketo-5-methylthio-1-phosphopentane phosphatase
MHSPSFRGAPAVFLDFDGTISDIDVVDAILDRYADPAWVSVEEEWRAGRLGSRVCLDRQMALVRASTCEMDALIDSIAIDPGFLPLLDACNRAGAPVHIVSDGFDYCIRRILARVPPPQDRLLAAVGVSASHLEHAGDRQWRTTFPFPAGSCEHGCATCKPAMMRAIASPGARTVFVGDGLSDRHAAAYATTVFAKASLATHCTERGIPYTRFETLADIAICLEHDLPIRA